MPSILSNAAHENCPGIPEIFEQGGLRKVTDDTLKALGIIIAPMRTPVDVTGAQRMGWPFDGHRWS